MLHLAFLLPLVAADAFDGLHSAVLVPGDLDGDGVPDVVSARRGPARGFGQGFGRARIGLWALSGATGRPLWRRIEPRFCVGALTALPDVDGDGVADLAAGLRNQGRRTRVALVSGRDGSMLRMLESPGPEHFGSSLAGGLDATGDGVADLFVGADDQALLYDGASWELVEQVVLVPRQSEGEDDGADSFVAARRAPVLDERDGRPLPGHRPDEQFGGSVALVPDRDGDGRAELAVGRAEFYYDPVAPGERCWVLHSARPELNLALDSPGWCLRAAGDLDGDGTDELVATNDSRHLRAFELDDGELSWEVDFRGGLLAGEGASLDVLPDLDGDGAAEVLVGANETGFDCDRGFAVVISGRTGEPLWPELDPVRLGPDGAPVEWDTGCRSGYDVAWLGVVDDVPRIALHLAQDDQVRVVSPVDGAVLWNVKLNNLSAPEADADRPR